MGNISSVQSLSHVRLFATPWTAARQASLSITNSWSLLKLMPIELVMPSNHLILCHPLLLLPSIFPSIRVFPNESSLRIRWPKYWSFSFSISPSSEYLGLISFRISSRKQLNWRPWNFQLSYFLHKSCPSWAPHPSRSSQSARLGALRQVHFFDCSVSCGFKAAPARMVHRWAIWSSGYGSGWYLALSFLNIMGLQKCVHSRRYN